MTIRVRHYRENRWPAVERNLAYRIVDARIGHAVGELRAFNDDDTGFHGGGNSRG